MKTFLSNWEFFLTVNFRDTLFVLQKYKATKQPLCCTRNLQGIVWNNGRLDYSELSNILCRAVVKDEYFAARTEKCKNRRNFLDNSVENLEDHICPKVQDLVVEEIWICSRHPFIHKAALHCADRKARLLGNWIMRHLKLSPL